VRAAGASAGLAADDIVATFFSDLAARGHEPLLHMAGGTLAFALTSGDRAQHWTVSMSGGTVGVVRGRRRADCTVRVSRELFTRLLVGALDPWTAYLRDEYQIEGEIGLMVAFQRLLPDARTARDHGGTDFDGTG
jgi:hypothetical protein